MNRTPRVIKVMKGQETLSRWSCGNLRRLKVVVRSHTGENQLLPTSWQTLSQIKPLSSLKHFFSFFPVPLPSPPVRCIPCLFRSPGPYIVIRAWLCRGQQMGGQGCRQHTAGLRREGRGLDTPPLERIPARVWGGLEEVLIGPHLHIKEPFLLGLHSSNKVISFKAKKLSSEAKFCHSRYSSLVETK